MPQWSWRHIRLPCGHQICHWTGQNLITPPPRQPLWPIQNDWEIWIKIQKHMLSTFLIYSSTLTTLWFINRHPDDEDWWWKIVTSWRLVDPAWTMNTRRNLLEPLNLIDSNFSNPFHQIIRHSKIFFEDLFLDTSTLTSHPLTTTNGLTSLGSLSVKWG